MNKTTLMLTLLMAVAPGMAISASVYKWTDTNGITHFGDRQPVGANSETVNVRSGTSTGNDRPTAQQRLGELQKQQQKDAEKKQETAVQTARRKQREANCETARSNLTVIESNARIRTEENGEMRYLTPDEIAEQRNKLEDVAAENCGSEDSK